MKDSLSRHKLILVRFHGKHHRAVGRPQKLKTMRQTICHILLGHQRYDDSKGESQTASNSVSVKTWAFSLQRATVTHSKAHRVTIMCRKMCHHQLCYRANSPGANRLTVNAGDGHHVHAGAADENLIVKRYVYW